LKFKFDLNSNWFEIYKTDLKKKKDFLFFLAYWAEKQPAHQLGPASRSSGGLAASHRGHTDHQERTHVAKWIRPIKREFDPIED
jgi:hypothetical protein